MSRALLLLLLGADGGLPFRTTPSQLLSGDMAYVIRNAPADFWEGEVACGNGAEPKLARKNNRPYLVCDARKDGGR